MFHDKKQLLKITTAFLVTACCIITLLLPNIFIAENASHINHKCDNGHCIVCIRIHNANTILNGIHSVLGSGTYAAAAAVFIFLFIIIQKKELFSHDTLISLKIRLDD